MRPVRRTGLIPDHEARQARTPVIDAVVFDLDGTLWDTSVSCAVAWNRVLARHRLPFRPITEHDVRGARASRTRSAGLRRLCARFPLFIVSNCQAGYIETFFQRTTLGGCFRDFECWGSTGLSKTENLRAPIERNRLLHPVFVGDTPATRPPRAAATSPSSTPPTASADASPRTTPSSRSRP